MFNIGIITLFPEMFTALQYGILGRAIKQGIVKLHYWNPRDYALDEHHRVDDRPYGGGPGMVMQVQPLRDAINAAKTALGKTVPVIYLSPQGKMLDQTGVKTLAARTDIIFVAGRYEGIDERLIETLIDEEWSIGDYVLSGGEFAAMVMIDAIVRLLPNVLGNENSALQDSFSNGPDGLLDYPHYTRPEEIDGKQVPSVLMSGSHQAIRAWRIKQALGRTWIRRPDLLAKRVLTPEEERLLTDFIRENVGETKP